MVGISAIKRDDLIDLIMKRFPNPTDHVADIITVDNRYTNKHYSETLVLHANLLEPGRGDQSVGNL